MGELTIVTLCQVLSNLTSNRCSLVENSHICRCVDDVIHPISSTMSATVAPDIMLSEVLLIFFVLGIWLSAIAFCLNQYKSLRRLETQVHYCVNRKDPLNIGDIKIVAREQDSIIYKKKRYSTLLDTQINPREIKALHYASKTMPSTISALVISRDDLSSAIPLSTTTRFDSSMHTPLDTHHEASEYRPYFRTDMESIRRNTRICYIQRTGSARYSTGLTVPQMSPSSSSHSAWNEGRMYETTSTQRLGVPSTSLGSNCYSVGDISLPVPNVTTKSSGEQLLDPRLISATVRRSLLALHRESQENVTMWKKKDHTRSENDVHGALYSLKKRMKSKSKCTQQRVRPHSNTVSSVSPQMNSNETDRRILDLVNTSKDTAFSITPPVQRSFRESPKSLPETETVQADRTFTTSVCTSTDEEGSIKTVSGQSF